MPDPSPQDLISPLGAGEPSLDAGEPSLDAWGGKGMNLSRLAAAGLPVPPGFVITTAAYRSFVDLLGGPGWIAGELATAGLGAAPHAPDAPAAASAAIRRRFDERRFDERRSDERRFDERRFDERLLPPALRAVIEEAYASLGGGPVAVRSSATAEDLPELSFAGQQDTFLNVVGTEALLAAVVGCWASLWTERAIAYRARNGVPQDAVALAVVVQRLVPAEVSGVLFTADPLTGRRDLAVVDAVFGLGEALVAGLAEPDHYAIDTSRGQIVERRLGAKATAVRPSPGGGTEQVRHAAGGQQALPDAQILALARYGRQIERLFGGPQDIEWAWAGGTLQLLQARPITSLYPLPEDVPASPLRVWISAAAVQGVLGPLTPCGRDLIATFVVRYGQRLGWQVTARTQRAFVEAGERLFIDVTALARHGLGRRIIMAIPDAIEEGIGQGLALALEDPRLSVRAERHPSPLARLRLIRRVLPLAVPLARRVARNLRRPDVACERARAAIAALTATSWERMSAAGGLRGRLDALDQLIDEMPPVFFAHVLPTIGPGLFMLNRLLRMAEAAGVDRDTVLATTRGMPHNVTTEMDLALWDCAERIRGDRASRDALAAGAAGELAEQYARGALPPVAQAAVAAFLARYGFHGVAEIDVARPRWSDDPTPVFQTLRSYLAIEDPEAAPDRVFQRSAQAAEAAVERVVDGVRRAPGGWWRARVARFVAGRMRGLAGMREFPKFAIMSQFGPVHDALARSGRELADAGALAAAGDVFFLRLHELRALAEGNLPAARALVRERRAAYEREERRVQVPRVLLSDGRAYYGGRRGPADAGEGTLRGTPVSPGVVEGPVRVVFDPHAAQLAPGEILVCPGTDPAWTPLFLVAGGLVMEVGGLMTHGAVVAREYGIPAIAGVDEATARLRTGQRARVDGSTGVVVILDRGEGT